MNLFEYNNLYDIIVVIREVDMKKWNDTINDNNEGDKNHSNVKMEFLKLSERERDSRVKALRIASALFLGFAILFTLMLVSYTYKWIRFEGEGADIGFYIGIAIWLAVSVALFSASIVFHAWNKRQKVIDKEKKEKCRKFLQLFLSEIKDSSSINKNKIDKNGNIFLEYSGKLKQAKKMLNDGLIDKNEYQSVEDAFNKFLDDLNTDDKQIALMAQEEKLRQTQEMESEGQVSHQEVRNIEKSISEIKSHFNEKDKEELRKKRVWETLSSVLDDYNKIIQNEDAVLYIQNYIKKENSLEDIEILSVPVKQVRSTNLTPIYRETDALDSRAEEIKYSLLTARNSLKDKKLIEPIQNMLDDIDIWYKKKKYCVLLDIVDQWIGVYEHLKASKTRETEKNFTLSQFEGSDGFLEIYKKFKKLLFLKESLVEQGLIHKDNEMAFYLVVSEFKEKYLQQQYCEFNVRYGLSGDEEYIYVLDQMFKNNTNQKDIEQYVSLKYHVENKYKPYMLACQYAEKLIRDYLFKIKSKKYLDSLLLDNKADKKTIEDVDLMSGKEFEHFISELFKKFGYQTEVTKASGDQGIDIIATKGLVKVAIQAKCYSGVVGNHAIMEAVAGMKYYDATKCMVVTNNFFTKSARELAESNNVELWDRSVLIEKIEEIN